MKKLKAVLSLAMVLLLVWTMSGCKARVQEENAAADTEIFDVQQEAAPSQGTQADDPKKDEPKKDESQKETVVDSSGGEIGGVIYDEVSKEKWLAEAELVLLGRVTEKKGEEDIPEQMVEGPSMKGVQAAHRRTVYTVMIDTLYKGVCAEGSVAVSVSNPLDYLKGEPYVTDPFELEIGKEYLFLLNWLNDEYFATETRTFLPDQAGGYANCTTEDPLRMTLSTEDLKAIKAEQEPAINEPTEEAPTSFETDDIVKELYFSLQELLNAATSETKTDLAKYFDHFYVPAAIPEGYTLYRITVWEYNIQYRYKLIADPDNDKMNITVTYANPNRFKGKEPMQPLVNQLGISLTEDGFLYYAKEGVVAFPVGDSRMTIQVPESMNTYEQIKSLCVATRYEVNAEHRGE